MMEIKVVMNKYTLMVNISQEKAFKKQSN